MVLDRLDHDDGVVHHDADGQHQAEERQVVDRVPEGVHGDERADQGDRHGQHRDQGRPPVLEEHEDDDGDENDRLERASSPLR